MQEHSYTLPMCSVGCTSDDSAATVNASVGTHPSVTDLSNDIETGMASATSTPELNLLLDKLTEILRFRSSCRRHFGVMQQQQQQQQQPPPTSTNLKRLQFGSFQRSPSTVDVSPMPLHSSTISTGAWKSATQHHKPSVSGRLSHHYHHKHHAPLSTNGHSFEKRRRLPCLLQRLIDEGNLIKEAVRRIKSQRFPHPSNLQPNALQAPSTPTTRSSAQMSSHLTSRLTPSASINILLPPQLTDSPTRTTSSPNRGISWFLSSNVFGVNASATNLRSGSGSPLRSCYSATAHDRAAMEIGIHDG